MNEYMGNNSAGYRYSGLVFITEGGIMYKISLVNVIGFLVGLAVGIFISRLILFFTLGGN